MQSGSSAKDSPPTKIIEFCTLLVEKQSWLPIAAIMSTCTSVSSSAASSEGPTQKKGRFQQLTDGAVVDEDALKQLDNEVRDLCRMVYQHIFPYKKFILKEGELDWGGQLQKRVYYKMNIEDKNDQTYWNRHRERVRKMLNAKRNSVMFTIRVKMVGK